MFVLNENIRENSSYKETKSEKPVYLSIHSITPSCQHTKSGERLPGGDDRDKTANNIAPCQMGFINSRVDLTDTSCEKKHIDSYSGEVGHASDDGNLGTTYSGIHRSDEKKLAKITNIKSSIGFMMKAQHQLDILVANLAYWTVCLSLLLLGAAIE